LQLTVELRGLVVAVGVKVSLEGSRDEIQVSIESGGIVVADVAIDLPEVAKNLCAGLVSVDQVCRNDPLTVALDGFDLASSRSGPPDRYLRRSSVWPSSVSRATQRGHRSVRPSGYELVPPVAFWLIFHYWIVVAS
jgi:hypothetical protein